jgi:hypothetical protein
MNYKLDFGFLADVTMKNPIFWNVTRCSPVEVHWCFVGTYGLHLHYRKVRQTSEQLAESLIEIWGSHNDGVNVTAFFDVAPYSPLDIYRIYFVNRKGW